MRECTQSFGAKRALIVLGHHWKQRTTFHPAVSHADVLRKSLVIVGRSQKLVSLPNPIPAFASERYIAALRHVIIGRDDKQWRCVCGGVGIRKICEPGNKTRTLRNLMRNLAVIALILADELDRGASGCEISERIESE